MVAAVVMIRAQREHIPEAAQAIADIEGVAEVRKSIPSRASGT
jgi:hypothetical protein